MLDLLKSVTRRAWIALTAFLTLVAIYSLPIIWTQRAAETKAWVPVLSAPHLEALLLLYGAILTAWLFWIDIRPEVQRRRAAQAALIPETAEAAQLKEEVVNFATNYLRQAFAALLEAHRLSAYVIKDSWDHPAQPLVWQAFSQLQAYDGRYFLAVNNRPGMMTLPKKAAQLVTVELLKQYYQKQHQLTEAVKILADNAKPLAIHGFDGALHKWVDLHNVMLPALKRLQSIPGLETMQEFDTRHLELPNCNVGIVVDALRAEAAG